MLCDLVVRNLALIEEISLELEGGLTALTGETGAGKTMLAGAVSLLVGGRGDPSVVRPGAERAEVEGRFLLPDGEEMLVRREFAASGRSRVFINGRLSSVSHLAETAAKLVDICGQRRHQSLLRGSERRKALDDFAGVETSRLSEIRSRQAHLRGRLEALGGDEVSRARELEVLLFQLRELDQAAVDDPEEEETLREAELELANAAGIRSAAERAAFLLGGDGPLCGSAAEAQAALGEAQSTASLADLLRRIVDLQAEAHEISAELRDVAEATQDDPQRLTEIVERRALLAELRRKYGKTLADVLDFQEQARRRLEELSEAEEVGSEIASALEELQEAQRLEAARVGAARREAAGALAAQVSAELRRLAMPKALLELSVSEEDPGENVEFLLAANAGSPLQPLSKIASGGEISRTMLALYVVLTQAPPTVVLDEVDAGVGGEAGVWVGRALARLATKRQVLVVTHLPQVAAYADVHVNLLKLEEQGSTRIAASKLNPAEREVELARMLSGSPKSSSARRHAAELLERAATERRSDFAGAD